MDGGGSGRRDAPAPKHDGSLSERDVRLDPHSLQDHLGLGFDPVRGLIAVLRLGAGMALRAAQLAPADHAGRAHPEQFRRAPPAQPSIQRRQRLVSKITGERMTHTCQSPSPKRSLKHPITDLGMPPDSQRRETDLASPSDRFP